MIKEKDRTKEWPLEVYEPMTDRGLHADILRCRMIVSLLRDYGIRHVIISSGARDVSIARLFESNDCFITHNVVDERSAVYYALGISNSIQEPVAVTCTSGTAVSNYLPGMTEAYHMHIPIVAITCDRYHQYMNQLEPQKTDHIGALRSAVKISVDLLPIWDELTIWDTRRRVSEALLELYHYGSGPVHINVPIGYLQGEYPPEDELILPQYPHIDRITTNDSPEVFRYFSKMLSEKKKILIVVGQLNRMQNGDQKIFDAFCEKYCCAVSVDHLSNMNNPYSVHTHDVLRKMKSDDFGRELLPDIVIYFGGKRVLNDPIIQRLREHSGKYDFWRIDADGRISDVCFCMTHMFEMAPTYFFKAIVDQSNNDVFNDKSYLKVWQRKWRESEHFDYENSRTFSAYHTVGKLMNLIPKGSILHLGIGSTFDRAHYFQLDPSVDVFCNMGTNGIDGSMAAYMGHVAVTDRPAYLIIGDLSFFYDMNSIWSKDLKGNIRILLNNDKQAGYLKLFGVKAITHEHTASARGWVESLGFTYLSASSKEEYEKCIRRFVTDEHTPMFLEAFLN